MITQTFELQAINSSEDVKAFFTWLEETALCNFHPDTPFNDYVDEDGNQSFTDEDCETYDRLMLESFAVFHGKEETSIDVYSFAMDNSKAWQAMMKGAEDGN